MAKARKSKKYDKRYLQIRKLTAKERKSLKAKLADKTLAQQYYVRYRVVAEMVKGNKPKDIGSRCQLHVHTVRNITHRFNAHGFERFEGSRNPLGRPAELSPEQITQLIKVALSKPGDLGLPFTQWSRNKLADYCKKKGLYPKDYSSEWLRRLLRREGISTQRTKTWKESPDPEFESKKTGS